MKIALSGSHGTGKTTLLQSLAPLNQITEVARDLIAKIGNPRDMENKERSQFQELLFFRQMKMELVAWDFFSDRSLVDILAYSQDLPIYGELLEEAKKYLKKHEYDIVFFLPIEFPMEKDRVRIEDDLFSPHNYRQVIEYRIIDIARELGVELVEVRGTIEEREKYVREYTWGYQKWL